MSYRTPSRPFDPTAISVMNLVINEIQELSVLGKYIFIPSHGPFYTESFVAFANGVLLLEGEDYVFEVLHSRATKDTGKEVACIVNVKNRNINEFSYTYQCVGGEYQNLFDVLKELAVGLDSVDGKNIHWVDITEVPNTLPAAAHYHHALEFDGWYKLIDPLDQVRNALISNDHDEIDKIYLYAQNRLAQLQAIVDNRLQELGIAMDDIVNGSGIPVGMIMAYRTNTLTESGTWTKMIDTFVYGLSSPAAIGDTFQVSEDPVLDFPDNLLLKDSLFEPLITDNDEYIFLDNEHPTVIGANDNGTGFHELYDATRVFLYRKQSGSGSSISATLTTEKDHIDKEEFSLITLTTTGFMPGVAVNYKITGIPNDSLGIPRNGVAQLDSNGAVSFNVWVVKTESQQNTISGTMEIEFFILDGRTVSLTYEIVP